jgi:hypothetical protein
LHNFIQLPQATPNIHEVESSLTFPCKTRKRKDSTCAYCNQESLPACKMPQHMRTAHPELLQCCECFAQFSVVEHLNRHALQKKHQAFRCQIHSCSSKFTRLDDLRRHNRKHQSDSKRYHCPHCEAKFTRNDHLTQHLTNFHKIGLLPGSCTSSRSCPHSSCPFFRQANDISLETMPFSRSKDYIEHMRRVHNESPFPCSEQGCSRIGGKGFFREMDLVKHRNKAHSASQSLEVIAEC